MNNEASRIRASAVSVRRLGAPDGCQPYVFGIAILEDAMRTYNVGNLLSGETWIVESDCVENAVYHVLIDVLGIEEYENYTEEYSLRGFYLVSHFDDRDVLGALFSPMER